MLKVPMTVEGAKRLREELETLKTVTRPQVIQAIAEARAHGDLKENAEYHAARERQSFVEGRIAEIEGKISNIQVIDVKTLPNTGKVVFGTTVTLINPDLTTRVTYTIVGEDEADVKKGMIAYTTPIASALLGKVEGDEVAINTPGGLVEYEIEKVVY